MNNTSYVLFVKLAILMISDHFECAVSSHSTDSRAKHDLHKNQSVAQVSEVQKMYFSANCNWRI